jgi:WD40 repeat protein
MRPTGELASGRGQIRNLIFSADGARLYASWDSDGVAEFNLATTPPTRREITKGGVNRSLALSPHGSQIACGYVDGSISVIDPATGGVAHSLEGHTTQVRALAFHPTRRLLASASDDDTARLWDLDTGESTVLRGHSDKVYALAFSPDGKTLATGSEDTTIVLWDIASGDELTRLRGHDAYVYSLAFSSDGAVLVSGSGDRTVRIWDACPVHERWSRYVRASTP